MAVVREAAARPEIVAITAAMPGATGLIGFRDCYPDRFFDVGIAEQHAVQTRPQAWPWAACDPSWPSTPLSSTGRGTRSITTSVSTASR